MTAALIIILIALIAIILYLYFYRHPEKKSGYTPYIDALIALLENNEALAIKKFQEAVNIDTDLIDAYIRLGNLYRSKGDLPRAIQIHQSLTVRPTLKKGEEKKVYSALVEDFLAANRPNKAISYLKELLKIDKKDKAARELLLKIYEDLESYADCISLYEEKNGLKKDEKRHAFYYAALANNKLKGQSPQDEEEAMQLFKKALKFSSNSLSALYSLEQYYERKGDLKKVKEYCLKIVGHHPKYAFLILPKLEKVYYELGSFNEVIPIYEKIFSSDPKNFSVGFALASLYEKKNDIDAAKNVYQKLSTGYPKSLLPKITALKLCTDDKSLHRIISQIEKMIKKTQYTCKNCRFETDKFTFVCPQCHAIESLLPSL